jgi:septal ring factor EnvC (AmiA/AmiB activator)
MTLSATQREQQREAVVKQLNLLVTQVNALTKACNQWEGDLADLRAQLLDGLAEIEDKFAAPVTWRQRLGWLLRGE